MMSECLSPRRGLSAIPLLPTAYAVGCILAPLRGYTSCQRSSDYLVDNQYFYMLSEWKDRVKRKRIGCRS
jgi:hypothetical protein